MENNLPIYKILSTVVMIMGFSTFLQTITIEGEIFHEMYSFQWMDLSSLVLGISGLVGLLNWTIGRVFINLCLVIFIIFSWYSFLVDFLPDGNVFLVELEVLKNIGLSFLFSSIFLISFHGNTYQNRKDQEIVNAHPFINHYPLDKILSFTIIGFGVAMIISVFASTIFEGSRMEFGLLEVSRMRFGLDTVLGITLLFTIGILGMFYWKVIRWILVLILAFLLVLGLFTFLVSFQEGFFIEEMLSTIRALTLVIGFILLFFNRSIMADSNGNQIDFYRSSDILDDL